MIAPGARVVVVWNSDRQKAEFLEQNAEPGDLVWDFDRVAALLWNRGESVAGVDLPSHEVAGTMAVFWALVRWALVSLPIDRRALLFIFDRERARIVATQLGAQYVELST